MCIYIYIYIYVYAHIITHRYTCVDIEPISTTLPTHPPHVTADGLGDGDGDDEQIQVDLNRIQPHVQQAPPSQRAMLW